MPKCLQGDPGLREGVRGMLVAQTIVPQAVTLARRRGIKTVVVVYDVRRGAAEPALTLF